MPSIGRWIDSRSTASAARIVFAVVFLFVWGLDTHGSFAGSGDEPHYQMIAHSLVFDHDLDLANDYADGTNLVGAGTLEPGGHAVAGTGGRLRPVHDIGLPVAFAPAFAVSYWIAERSSGWMSPRVMARARLNPPLVLRHLLSLAMVALTGIMAILLFQTCRSMADANGTAAGWTLACVLSPPILSHSFLFFTEIPSALIVALYCRDILVGRLRTAGRAFAVGTAAGFLILLHIRNLGLIAAMIGLVLLKHRRNEIARSHAFWFVLPVVALAGVRTAINLALWGTLVTSPHVSAGAVEAPRAVLAAMAIRTMGLLFDQEHGLLPYAPIYLVVVPAAFFMAKRDRTLFRDLSVLIASYLVPIVLPFVNRHGWDGGWSPAARFLVPITPVLVLMALPYVRRAFERVPGTLLLLFTLQGALDAIYWSHPKALWNDGTGTSALLRLLPRGAELASWLPSWHQPSVYTAIVSVGAFAIWVVLGSVLASRQIRMSAHAGALTRA